MGTNLLRGPVVKGLVLNTRDVTKQSVVDPAVCASGVPRPAHGSREPLAVPCIKSDTRSRAARVATWAVTVMFLDIRQLQDRQRLARVRGGRPVADGRGAPIGKLRAG